MNNNTALLLAAAIVAAAVIVKLVPSSSQPGRYQIDAGSAQVAIRLDTATGDAWLLNWAQGGNSWRPFADNGGSH
jgi:hypothetical protein